VVVVGAGALGGWTALQLVRAGAEVRLLDAWGPGNRRSSSGGPTRVLRCGYGPAEEFTALAARARRLWQAEEAALGRRFFHPCGVLWLITEEDGYAKATLDLLRKHEVAFERLAREEIALRWPQISTEGVRWGFLETEAGFLDARPACRRVAERVVEEGGSLELAAARPGRAEGGRLKEVLLEDGGRLEADLFVFACGPWMGTLFPEVFAERLFPTRQEIFSFGPPAGDPRWGTGQLPVWIEYGVTFWYGIPDNSGRGFKIGDDTRGPLFDPTGGERVATRDGMESARRQLARRFPVLRDAPLLDSRVCQYADTRDGHFCLEFHPEWENLLLLGGGSGHAFKHAPALGQDAAARLLEAAS